MENKYTKLLGQPQGDEMIWGREILRMKSNGKFTRLLMCQSYSEASAIFYSWLKENNS